MRIEGVIKRPSEKSKNYLAKAIHATLHDSVPQVKLAFIDEIMRPVAINAANNRWDPQVITALIILKGEGDKKVIAEAEKTINNLKNKKRKIKYY